ncbi:hypothetical protein SO802_027948 [Lithocarpus litseifolius]|uniref:Uncharacterized protein n=1 Tax=Lithocarpus litseifolius TaxID=425828 RepID=A0AAW2BSH1_9ROSI
MEPVSSIPQRPGSHDPSLELLASETVKHVPGQEVEAWRHYATVLQFITYQRLNISCEGAFPQNMVGSSIVLWLHRVHFGSICTIRRRRLNLVGRILEHARQIKFQTSGEVFIDQTLFHIFLS